MACTAAIGPDAARGLFDRLTRAQGEDDCTLEDVSTDPTHMTVLWKLRGTPLPVAEIVPRECAASDAVVGPAFAVRVPARVRDACPATARATIAIVQQEGLDAHGATAQWRPVALGAACTAVLALVLVVERSRRRPRG